MHCFNLTAPYAVLTKLVALRLECVHYRLNWVEKGVDTRYVMQCYVHLKFESWGTMLQDLRMRKKEPENTLEANQATYI